MSTNTDYQIALASQQLAESRWEAVPATDPNTDVSTLRLRVIDGWIYRMEYEMPGTFLVAAQFIPQGSLRASGISTNADHQIEFANQQLAESRWEAVPATDLNPDATTYRLRVRGGWIYRIEYDMPGAFYVATCFVPQESLNTSEF